MSIETRTKRKNKLHKGKPAVLMTALVLIICLAVGGTVAFLYTQTDSIKNIFNPSTISSDVYENLDNEYKKNVCVENTGDTDAYIRAMVVVTWQDEEGNVYPEMPVAGTDYQITYNQGTSGVEKSWILGADGFWYYTSAVSSTAPNNFTTALINVCTPFDGKAPAGYTLHVEVIGSAIQSEPDAAVLDAWKSGVESVSTSESGVKLLDITTSTTDTTETGGAE